MNGSPTLIYHLGKWKKNCYGHLLVILCLHPKVQSEAQQKEGERDRAKERGMDKACQRTRQRERE